MPTIYQTRNQRTVLYTVDEAARSMGISKRTMQTYLRDQRLPSVLIKHKRYISESNLHRFISGAKAGSYGQHFGKYARRNQSIAPAAFPEFVPTLPEDDPDPWESDSET